MPLAAVIGAFAVGGCAYQLGSLASKSDADVEQTGAIGQPAQEADPVPPPEVDLAYARAVAADALARSGKDDSVNIALTDFNLSSITLSSVRMLNRGRKLKLEIHFMRGILKNTIVPRFL